MAHTVKEKNRLSRIAWLPLATLAFIAMAAPSFAMPPRAGGAPPSAAAPQRQVHNPGVGPVSPIHQPRMHGAPRTPIRPPHHPIVPVQRPPS